MEDKVCVIISDFVIFYFIVLKLSRVDKWRKLGRVNGVYLFLVSLEVKYCNIFCFNDCKMVLWSEWLKCLLKCRLGI